MAHFAELIQKTDPTGFTTDKHWVVERVIVVDNSHVSADEALDGENWCSTFFGGGTWKQTSYNSTIRKNYAGPGYTYDEDRDAFIPPKPYNSWILNEETCRWDPPVVRPELTNEEIEDKKYYNWNEETQQWDLL